MRSLIAFLLMLAVAAGLVVVVWPNAWFTLQLALEPAPTALPVPVQGVSAAQLRDSWGNARAGGRRHEGIDIFAARGTPVRSTTRGIIWRVGEDRLGGHVVLVLGPGRELHYYAHLDHFAPIAAGERVQAGAVLGYVGNTGDARGGPTHLHYGIYVPFGIAGAAPSGAIDPYPLLSAGAAAPHRAGRNPPAAERSASRS